ncbi:peptidoglycan-binding protein [Trichocoleus sp. DQ-A3]|uniref:peptidoglycan-binding domain-containing protein n=1 Tax=Cyanophyceae TaxID=3028117 RepID=UPI001689FC82|nr:peptidoglycan-binding domain-containing protein [Coleofasciculus sp. FACHB-125]MBD1903637.1 peptidoglycan-binding protein [Coleofasciculus sp. FACHB-125]
MSTQALPTLRSGSTGDQVTYLQEILNKINYGPLDVDGEFGSATEKAVKKFQTDFQVNPIDGIVGTKTWDKLHTQVQ